MERLPDSRPRPVLRKGLGSNVARCVPLVDALNCPGFSMEAASNFALPQAIDITDCEEYQ